MESFSGKMIEREQHKKDDDWGRHIFINPAPRDTKYVVRVDQDGRTPVIGFVTDEPADVSRKV